MIHASSPVAVTSMPAPILRSLMRAVAPMVAILGFIGLIWLLPPRLGFVVYLGLCGWALLGPVQAIHALTLAWLGCTLNLDLFTLDGMAVALKMKWLILLSAAGTVGWHLARRPQPVPAMALFIFVFTGVSALTSMVTSFEPITSILKLAAFFVGATTVVLAFHLAKRDAARLEHWFMSLALAIVVASVPLLFAEVGYKWIFRGPTLFKGILIQPQEFAVFVAPLVAWLTGSLLTGGRYSRLAWALAPVLWLLLIVSGSRTGFGGAVGAIAVALLVALGFSARWRQDVGRIAARPQVVIVLLLLCGGALFNFDRLAAEAESFLHKRGESLVGEYELSRAMLVVPALDNFAQTPLIGHGFGVRSKQERYWVLSDVGGIPLSAPTEKGILYVAILEEVGLLGMILFLFLIVSVFRPIVMHSTFQYGCAGLAILLVNLGEANFFSFGGMGLYEWLIIAFAALCGPELVRAGRPDAAHRR